MNLSDEQKQTIAQRLADGASISDIQRLITDEFEVHATFMETRFLIDDLDLDLKEPEQPAAPEVAADSQSNPDASVLDSSGEQAAASNDSPGGVSVEIDSIKRPGAALSGSVTFRDGVSAKWYVDPMGRLGLDPDQEGYQPSPEDIEVFQVELQNKMQGTQL